MKTLNLILGIAGFAVSVGCWWAAREAYHAGNVAGTVYWIGLMLSYDLTVIASRLTAKEDA